MSYIHKTIKTTNALFHEFKFAGNYGKKGERKKKCNPTPDQMKKQNEWSRRKKLTYLIENNFKDDDLWITLKYPAGYRPDKDIVKKDFEKFRRNMHYWYSKKGEQFKFVYRVEIGKKGGVHIHLLANNIPEATEQIKNKWKSAISHCADPRHSYVYFAHMEQSGSAALADYIAKAPNDVVEGQLELFTDIDSRKYFLRTGSSRNLDRPVVETRVYSRRTVERTIRDGIEATQGYYVEPDSIRYGINPVTGYSYLYYSERVLDAPRQQDRVKVRRSLDGGGFI